MNTYVRNKNVIIVGPAACLLDDAKLVDIGSYDIVCKLNDHWRVQPENFELLTRRTDLIVHCMGTNQYSVADLRLWKSRNIKVLSTIDFKHPGMAAHDKTQKFRLTNQGVGLKLDFIPHRYKLDYQKVLKTNPSTGVMAILYLLDSGAKSVTTVGFDFYDTLYHDYKNENLLKNIQDNKVGNHNPNTQIVNFKKYVKKYGVRFKPVGKLKEKLSKV